MIQNPGEYSDWLIALRLRQFGDVLSALEALRVLKAHQPDRGIVYVVDGHFHGLLKHYDFIDRLVDSPGGGTLGDYLKYVRQLRSLQARTTLDFHGNPRSAMLTALIGSRQRVGFDVRIRKVAYNVVIPRAEFQDGLKLAQNSVVSAVRLATPAGVAASTDHIPEMRVESAAIGLQRDAILRTGITEGALARGRLIGINPGRIYAAKAWPADRFVTLARELASIGFEVLVMWGPGEEDMAERVAKGAGRGASMAPEVSLQDIPALLKNLRLLVTIDSGLKHVAVATRVPTLTLFGSTDPREWHIGGVDDQWMWKGLSCSPCRRLDCPFGVPCMDFTVENVLERVLDMLSMANTG